MKRLLATALIIATSCCPIKTGPPGDKASLEWTPPQPNYDQHIINCEGDEIDSIDIRTSGTTVRNCIVNNYIRIWGIQKNANDAMLRIVSKDTGYVEWVRNSAPTSIKIENTRIKGTGTIPLYIGPGSTFVTINNVEIHGTSISTMIYLGAESSRVTIQNSIIDATNAPREAIAIDSSDYNIIENNKIVHKNGGIYLYRNCGENGVTRQTTPSSNNIRHNYIDGPGIAIWLSSRDGNRCYCDEDSGTNIGSSGSDLDHSRYNTVFDNMLGEGIILEGMSADENIIF